MSFPNRYAGHCSRCRRPVPAGEGICVKASGGGYDVFCVEPCEPTSEPYEKPAPRSTLVAEGMYVRGDGEVFRVQRSGYGRCYAKHVAIDASDPDYVRVHFDYEPGAIYSLTDEMKMTEVEAKAFGARYGFCCVCCIELTDNRSVLAGYGKTCAKNNGWWYPTIREAKALMADQELAVA